METIKLQVSKKIYTKVLWLLSQFKDDDVKIITSSDKSTKAYLQNQLDLIDSGKVDFLSEKELNILLEERITKYDH